MMHRCENETLFSIRDLPTVRHCSVGLPAVMALDNFNETLVLNWEYDKIRARSIRTTPNIVVTREY